MREEERKKNAPTETGPLPQSHAQELFCHSRAWKPLTRTQSDSTAPTEFKNLCGAQHKAENCLLKAKSKCYSLDLNNIAATKTRSARRQMWFMLCGYGHLSLGCPPAVDLKKHLNFHKNHRGDDCSVHCHDASHNELVRPSHWDDEVDGYACTFFVNLCCHMILMVLYYWHSLLGFTFSLA